jgi:hypothetical protein
MICKVRRTPNFEPRARAGSEKIFPYSHGPPPRREARRRPTSALAIFNEEKKKQKLFFSIARRVDADWRSEPNVRSWAHPRLLSITASLPSAARRCVWRMVPTVVMFESRRAASSSSSSSSSCRRLRPDAQSERGIAVDWREQST